MLYKLVLLLLSVFLPPVAVFLKHGVGSVLLVNILLCLLFVIPGVIHAIWVTLIKPD